MRCSVSVSGLFWSVLLHEHSWSYLHMSYRLTGEVPAGVTWLVLGGKDVTSLKSSKEHGTLDDNYSWVVCVKV